MHITCNTPPAAGPAAIGKMSSEVVTGCAIKKGENDPAIKPDAEYPAWLFQLMQPEASLAELERVYKADGLALDEVCSWGGREGC
jgi:hypothetical protein